MRGGEEQRLEGEDPRGEIRLSSFFFSSRDVNPLPIVVILLLWKGYVGWLMVNEFRGTFEGVVNLFRLFQFGIKDVTMCITEGDVFKRNVISIPWSNSIRAPDIELGPTGALIYS